MNNTYKLIIFDLDGTLIDTMGGFADIAGELIAVHYGWSFEKGRKGYLESSGIPFFQQLDTMFPGDHRNKDTANIFEKNKISVFTRETISEKTLETLHWLQDFRYRTAISSNNTQLLVKEFIHRDNVPVNIALGYKSGFYKGSPHFLFLKDYFKIAYQDMLFIGDSLKDAELALKNGVPFIGKVGTFSEIDFQSCNNLDNISTITEIHEIKNVLEEQ